MTTSNTQQNTERWTLYNVCVQFPKKNTATRKDQYHPSQIWKQYRNQDHANQFAKQFREKHPDCIVYVSVAEY